MDMEPSIVCMWDMVIDGSNWPGTEEETGGRGEGRGRNEHHLQVNKINLGAETKQIADRANRANRDIT